MKKYPFYCLLAFVPHAFCSGQVPVSKEPMHHNVLENSRVRLLDVHIPPGDTSQMHIHATPSVFVVLSNVKTGSQVIIEEDRSKSPVIHYGNIYFEGFYKQPRIHRVWNSDSTEFHVMDIELPNRDFKNIDSPIRNEAFTFLFEEKPVRAYRLTLQTGAKISLPARKADILMILLADPVDQIKVERMSPDSEISVKHFFRKGDYLYLQGGNRIEIINGGILNSTFAFFELK